MKTATKRTPKKLSPPESVRVLDHDPWAVSETPVPVLATSVPPPLPAPPTIQPAVFEEIAPPTVAEALMGEEQIKVIIGPVRSGKTKAVMRYILAHCWKYAALFPGQTIRWAVVRDTYANASGTNLKTLLELEPRGRWGRYNEQKQTFAVTLPKGQFAEIKFFGLDDPEAIQKLQSLDLSGFVICEPAGGLDAETERVGLGVPADAYLMLLNRLSHPIGLTRTVGILEGNAPSAGHWVAKLLRDQARVEIVPVMTAAGLPGVDAEGRWVRRQAIPGRTAKILLANIPAWEAPILQARPDYYDNLEAHYASTGKGSAYIRRYLRGEWLPVLAGGLDRRHVPTIARDDCPEFDAIVATLDPSTGAAKGDRSALAVCGVTRSGFAYLLDLQVGRFEYQELIERIFAMQARWAPGVVGIEAVGFQVWLKAILEEKGAQRAVRVPVRELKRDSKQSKALRIEGTLCVRVSERRLVVVEGCPNLDALWAEMEGFGQPGGHDDVLDALADLDQVVSAAFPAADVGPDDRAVFETAGARAKRPLLPQVTSLGPDADRGEPVERTTRFWSRRGAGFWR